MCGIVLGAQKRGPHNGALEERRERVERRRSLCAICSPSPRRGAQLSSGRGLPSNAPEERSAQLRPGRGAPICALEERSAQLRLNMRIAELCPRRGGSNCALEEYLRRGA